MALILSPKIVITTCYNKRKPLKVEAELNTALWFNKAMQNFNILTLDCSSFRQCHLVTRDIAKDFFRLVSLCPLPSPPPWRVNASLRLCRWVYLNQWSEKLGSGIWFILYCEFLLDWLTTNHTQEVISPRYLSVCFSSRSQTVQYNQYNQYMFTNNQCILVALYYLYVG